MTVMTVSRNRWIEIQQLFFSTAEGKEWYNQGWLPRVHRNIGDITLLDLEFKSAAEQSWFILKWM